MNDRSNKRKSEYQPFAPLPSHRMTGGVRPRPPLPPPETSSITPQQTAVVSPRSRADIDAVPRITTPVLALLFLILVAGIGLIAYESYFSDRIVPGVRVLGEDVGGMQSDQAQARLQEQFGDPNQLLARFGGEQIVLRDGNRTFRAWPWELGFRSDLKPALDAAFAYGHRDDWLLSLIEQGRAVWLGADVSPAAAFDQDTARSYVSLLAAQIDQPARDAEFRLEGLSIVEQPAQKGRRVDGEETFKRIQTQLLNPNPAASDIEIAVEDLEPQPVQTAQARAQIERFLSTPIVLTFDDRAWAIDQATLASLLTLQAVTQADGTLQYQVKLDHAGLLAKLNSLAREINQDPRDARFFFDNGTLTPTVVSQEGRALDVDGTVAQIEQKLAAAATAQARLPGNAAPDLAPLAALRDNIIPLSVQITKPGVATSDAAKMGIKELVAQGTSNFAHSIPGRIQNIKTATASYDGVVIPPGGTFSFVKYLKDVVEANGYEDAYVIFNNRTVLGPGGGVCQVSSTMFRAAFFGGFPIVERWAHAYRVGYYEPPVGLDATVFAPDVDFKFVNDTPNYLLIQPALDVAKTSLTFNLYGTKMNREVKLVGPEVTNVKPHGPAIYTDDPSLAKGTVKQVDFAVDGEDVTVWREIYVNDQLIQRTKFFSRYQPWQARFQRGTRE